MNDFIEITNVHKFSDIVCPISKASLWINKDETWLYCIQSQLAYPIHNQIPVMLPTEARVLTDNERAVLKSKCL